MKYSCCPQLYNIFLLWCREKQGFLICRWNLDLKNFDFEINPSILSVAISLVARNGLLIGYNLFTKTYRFYSEAKWPVLFKKNAIFYDGRHFYTTKGRDRFLWAATPLKPYKIGYICYMTLERLLKRRYNII